MDILEKARSAQNVLEQLVAKVPGFAGYQDKDLRRDADRLRIPRRQLRRNEWPGPEGVLARHLRRVAALGAGKAQPQFSKWEYVHFCPLPLEFMRRHPEDSLIRAQQFIPQPRPLKPFQRPAIQPINSRRAPDPLPIPL